MNSLSNLTLAIFILGYCQAQTHFRNPILDEFVHHSSVIKYQGSYYMARGIGNTIELLTNPVLSSFRDAERRVIYTAASEMEITGTPRILEIRDGLYIYFSLLNNNGTFQSNRMNVIKNLDPCNPLKLWSNETRLLPGEDIMAHRGTVMEYNHGDLYFIWTGPIEDGAPHNLFIARMEDPMNAIGPRTLLRAPTMEWEFTVNVSNSGVNESPVILQHHGAIFLVFSASNSMYEDYCLGIMGIDGGTNPMIPSNWWNDVNHCVFTKNKEDYVLGPGHVSFVQSPDDSETWMVYHAWDLNGGFWNQTVRIQKLDWGEMNTPKFPRAVGLDVDMEVPAGEYQ